MTGFACRICGNAAGNERHFPKEMMFGWGEAFEYVECAACGCLQILEVPADLARFYPREAYYSFKPPRRPRLPAWLLWLRRERARHCLGERSIGGALLGALSRDLWHMAWMRRAGATLDSRILDVGCGAGGLLLKLQRDGFRSLLGADPFIGADIDYGNGVRVLKRELAEVPGRFDLVMLHHSFEHMPDPAAALRALRGLLAPRGTLLVRIPVADSELRRRYGVNWMAWDAPRHLFLHTRRSMAVLAAGAGLEIAEVICDMPGQHYASCELYARGVPYVEHPRYCPGRSSEACTHAQWGEYERRAAEANARGEGDTVCFYLKSC
jgi:SAM-dependent methyltransferase